MMLRLVLPFEKPGLARHLRQSACGTEQRGDPLCPATLHERAGLGPWFRKPIVEQASRNSRLAKPADAF